MAQIPLATQTYADQAVATQAEADAGKYAGVYGGHRDRLTNKLPPSLTSWTKLGDVLANDAPWKSYKCGVGMSVVWDHDTGKYAMMYCGVQDPSGVGDATQMVCTFGVAYSDDGDTWIDYGSNPFFAANATAGQPDSGGVTFPQVRRYNGQWFMYYIGFPTAGYEQGKPSVCYATADSLTGPWTRHGAIVTPDVTFAPAGFDATSVIYRPTVVKVGATYYLIINGGPHPGAESIYWCSAPGPAGPWTYGGFIANASTLTNGAITDLASDPEVVHIGDRWYMMVWTRDGGVYLSWWDEDQFPNGALHVYAGGPMLTSTSSVRRVSYFETLPYGARLLANTRSESKVGLWVPSKVRTRMSQLPTLYGSGQARINELVEILSQMGLKYAADASYSDSFSRPDSSAMGSTEVGALAYATSGTGAAGWTIAGHRAKFNNAADGALMLNVGAAFASNVAVCCRIREVNYNFPIGIIVRGTSATAYTKIYRNANNWSNNGAVGVNIFDPDPLAVNDLIRCEIASDGTTMRIYVNDVLKGTWTGVTANSAGGWVGIQGSGGYELQIDNLSVTSLAIAP